MAGTTTTINPRLGWTRIHLIYFALAAFDLTAVGAGLWLSNRTIGQFSSAITSVEGGIVLHAHASHLHEATTELAGPLNDLLIHKDVGRARTELAEAEQHFAQETSEEAFLEEIAKGTASGEKLKDHDAEDDVEVFTDLLGISPQIARRYEDLEESIRESGQTMITMSEKAIGMFEAGDLTGAATLLGEMNSLAREQQAAVGNLITLSDDHVREGVTESWRQIEENAFYEYAIGGLILAIIAMVITYGHFVGRLLRRKYEELERAHIEADDANHSLHQVNDEVVRLNVELAERLKMLTRAQEENLRKGRMAQLGQLTATVAHELRNPLGAVRTSAFLLERKLKDAKQGVEPQLQRINNGIVRCDNIISQLLDYSRTSAPALERARIDDWLAGVIQEEAERLPSAVSVECDLGLDDVEATFDQSRMRRVMVNLLSNASEAMVGNGEDVSGKSVVQPCIKVTSRLTGRGVEISVSDNGPGIAPDVVERILEPLFTTKSFGTGLGLPAVEKILNEHQGGLEVESEPGHGATFTAWFPVAAAGTKAA